MIAAALGSGLGLVGGWLDSAVAFIRRLGAPLIPSADFGKKPDSPEVGEPPRWASGPQAEVEEAKYHLGRCGPSERSRDAVVDRETAELPRAYGRDRVVLLPRDPWWTFAYWEITPGTRVRALRALGAEAEGAREILRVYDVTFITFTGDNAWLSFDVELPPGANRWYLNVGRPAASFCVEMGIRTTGGRFLPLARSNVVTTARSAPSPDTTLRWVDLRQAPGTFVEVDRPAPGRVSVASAPLDLPTSAGAGPRSSDVHAPPAH